MDRLVDAVAEYQYSTEASGFSASLDAAAAEVGAVEVVKGAASLPTPGAEAWRVSVREAVYATREVQCVGEAVS